jgi:hypothetical protein
MSQAFASAFDQRIVDVLTPIRGATAIWIAHQMKATRYEVSLGLQRLRRRGRVTCAPGLAYWSMAEGS